jgi:hypothetical protein
VYQTALALLPLPTTLNCSELLVSVEFPTKLNPAVDVKPAESPMMTVELLAIV